MNQETYYNPQQLFKYKKAHPVIFPIDLSLYKLKKLIEAHEEFYSEKEDEVRTIIGEDQFTEWLISNEENDLYELLHQLRSSTGFNVVFKPKSSCFGFNKLVTQQKEIDVLRNQLNKVFKQRNKDYSNLQTDLLNQSIKTFQKEEN